MGVRVRALLVVISTALTLAGCSLFDNDPDPQPNPTGTVPTGEWAPVNVAVPLTLGWQPNGGATYVDVDTMAVVEGGQYAEFATVDSGGDLYFNVIRHSGATPAPTRQPDAQSCAQALRDADASFALPVPVGRTDTPTFCLYTHRDDAAAQGIPPLLAIVETTGVELKHVAITNEEYIEFVHVLVSTYRVPAD